MFKLTAAQANAIQELNWVYIEECPDDQPLYDAIGTRSLTTEMVMLLDMDFVVSRAEDALEDCECFGEPEDRIGHTSRLRSMRKVQAKVVRYLAKHEVFVNTLQAAWNTQQTGGHC